MIVTTVSWAGFGGEMMGSGSRDPCNDCFEASPPKRLWCRCCNGLCGANRPIMCRKERGEGSFIADRRGMDGRMPFIILLRRYIEQQ